LLSALLNVPDPALLGSAANGIGGLDIIDSPNPLMSLVVAVAAAAIAGLTLAPLDLIRTRYDNSQKLSSKTKVGNILTFQ
jgi:mitochondrial fusion and transport protein UGO1